MTVMDSEAIQVALALTAPFLFVDGVDEIVPGKYAAGHKNVGVNEWFFANHAREARHMPETLMGEAAAQLFTLLLITMPEHAGKRVLYSSSGRMMFTRSPRPGERLCMEATMRFFRRGVAMGKVAFTIDGCRAGEVELTHVVRD